jgi:hypothetical protein
MFDLVNFAMELESAVFNGNGVTQTMLRLQMIAQVDFEVRPAGVTAQGGHSNRVGQEFAQIEDGIMRA